MEESFILKLGAEWGNLSEPNNLSGFLSFRLVLGLKSASNLFGKAGVFCEPPPPIGTPFL